MVVGCSLWFVIPCRLSKLMKYNFFQERFSQIVIQINYLKIRIFSLIMLPIIYMKTLDENKKRRGKSNKEKE